MPVALPPVPAVELDTEGLQLVIKANRELAYLEGLASKIPSLLFPCMCVRRLFFLYRLRGHRPLFIDLGNLKENKKTGRARTFSYAKYLVILRRDT